jgi:hypothetical protein
MGELSLRLKTSWAIVSLDFASKNGFRTASKISESTLSARISLPSAQQARILFLVKIIKYKN